MHMKYPQFLDSQLHLDPPAARAPLVLDLFAGCGGLALGFEAAGFRTVGFEMDADACATYRANLHGPCIEAVLTVGHDLGPSADVIIGGPPCQPFSVGGSQKGHQDSRNGFPAFLSAVERYRPKLALFENVRGVLYRNRSYFDEVLGALAAFGYVVDYRLLNAVDFGVPQRRERMFAVAHRGGWEWPALGRESFTAGDALGTMAFETPPGSKFLTVSMDRYVAKYELASKCVRPRDLHLDRPSRTVTCRNLNGATGDMLRVRLPDGRRRRLAVREGARLQSFPDWFQFHGSEGSQFNQVGNAVPPAACESRRGRGEKMSGSKRRVRDASEGWTAGARPTRVGVRRVIWTRAEKKVDDAMRILEAVGFPLARKSPKMRRRLARILLAICNVKPDTPWSQAAVWRDSSSWSLRSREVIAFINEHYGENISPGSYDDIRRKNLDYLVAAKLVLASAGRPDALTNDGTRSYAANPAAAYLFRQFGNPEWATAAESFVGEFGSLSATFERGRGMKKIPVTLSPQLNLELLAGPHNELQKAIVEEFLPRFARGAEVLYIGDAQNKNLHVDAARLKQIGFFEIGHDRLPDVVAHDAAKNWLFLIEAVHSSNPISSLRHKLLEDAAAACTAGLIFVSVFKDRSTFAKWVKGN